MKIPGVETNPIKKLTGEHGFTQTFFTDARIPATGLMGVEGGGWKVAMRTLEFERGTRGGQAGGYVAVGSNAFEVLDLAKRMTRSGKPVLDDPQVADQMVEFLMEIQALSLNGQRTQVPNLIADHPQGIPLASKLMGTEMSRRLNEFAIRLTGARAPIMWVKKRPWTGGSGPGPISTPSRRPLAGAPRRSRPILSASTCSACRNPEEGRRHARSRTDRIFRRPGRPAGCGHGLLSAALAGLHRAAADRG